MNIWLFLFTSIYFHLSVFPFKIGNTQNATTPVDRIVNGQNATIEEFPYMVSIMYRGQHICGGVITINNYATTVAQCVYGIPKEELTVRLGSSFRDHGGTVHNISRIEINSQYNPKTLDNNDAFFTIDNFGLASPIVKAIPPNFDIPEDGASGVIPGWGRLQAGSPLSEQLKVVELPVVNFRVCQSQYKRLTEKMHFCAGYLSGLRGPCEGDTGGPFVVNGKLTGWFSFSYGCAQPNYPGVFTAIDW